MVPSARWKISAFGADKVAFNGSFGTSSDKMALFGI
jgi:hypothetical protein